MTPNQIVKYFGSDTKAAAALGKSVTCIKAWRSNGIPIWSQHAIAHITKDALKVEEK
jgi:hypothetical protein